MKNVVSVLLILFFFFSTMSFNTIHAQDVPDCSEKDFNISSYQINEILMDLIISMCYKSGTVEILAESEDKTYIAVITDGTLKFYENNSKIGADINLSTSIYATEIENNYLLVLPLGENLAINNLIVKYNNTEIDSRSISASDGIVLIDLESGETKNLKCNGEDYVIDDFTVRNFTDTNKDKNVEIVIDGCYSKGDLQIFFDAGEYEFKIIFSPEHVDTYINDSALGATSNIRKNGDFNYYLTVRVPSFVTFFRAELNGSSIHNFNDIVNFLEVITPPPPSSEFSSRKSNEELCTSGGVLDPQCFSCLESGGIWIAIGCVDPTPLGIMTRLIQIGLGVMGGVALLQLILAGIQYQRGNEEEIAKARAKIIAVLSGLFILVFSIVILRTIGVNILDVVPSGMI